MGKKAKGSGATKVAARPGAPAGAVHETMRPPDAPQGEATAAGGAEDPPTTTIDPTATRSVTAEAVA